MKAEETTQPEFEELAKTLGFDRFAHTPGSTILPGTLASSAGARPRAPNDTALELLSVLGRGGMGVVWTAKQPALDRIVAVKRLGEPPFGPRETDALLVEARTTGALEHPGIVPVHELRLDGDGSPLLVMKRVEGVTLGALVSDSSHDAWKELEQRHGDRLAAICDVLMRVSDALQFAHSRGVIHRDVKSDNVMIGAFGEVYLLDWGVALETARPASGVELVGTPAYMAPEMVRGDATKIDARSDVYLLGSTLHHALTRRPRHEGATVHAVLLAAFQSSPPVLSAEVPAELASLITRSTSADPAARPASAAAFREEVAGFLRHRASNRLVEGALGRLQALDLASPESNRALTESRFGLAQALREWPENPQAALELERVLSLCVQAELTRGSPGTAATLLGEIKTPAPELIAAVRAAEAKAAESASLAAKARTDAVDRDASLSAAVRRRMAIIFVFTLGVFVTALLSIGGKNARDIGYPTAFLMDLGFLAISVSLLVFTRARVLVNRWSRDAVGLFMVAAIGTTLSHGLGWLRGDDVLARGDSPTQLVLAVVFGVGSMLLSRRLLLPAIVGCLAAAASAMWPQFSLWGSAITALAGVIVLAQSSATATHERS